MADLKKVYAAIDEQTALAELENFDEKWSNKYPKIAISWREKWANLSTYFKYPQEVRTLIYTTNAIEGFNRQLRKVTLFFIHNKSIYLCDIFITLQIKILFRCFIVFCLHSVGCCNILQQPCYHIYNSFCALIPRI